METTQLTVRRNEGYLTALWRAHGGAGSWFLVRLLGAQGVLAAVLLLVAGWVGPGLVALGVGTGFEVLYWTVRSWWLDIARQRIGDGWSADVRLDDDGIVHTTTRARTIVPWTAPVTLSGEILTVRLRGAPLVIPLGALASVVRERLTPRRRGGRPVRTMAPKVTPRVRLLLAHAAARGAAGAGQLFHAILSDPDQVLALADAGFDPDILEAAMEQSAGPGATWLTSFLDWLYEDHEEHLTMADLVAWAQEQPELAPVWLAALEPVEDRSELVPEAGPGRALVVLNDDRTALDFVAEQIQEVTGLGPLEAVRLAMVAHDRGHVRVSVPDPERAVRRIARAARVAGYPLQTQVGL